MVQNHYFERKWLELFKTNERHQATCSRTPMNSRQGMLSEIRTWTFFLKILKAASEKTLLLKE